MTRGEVITSIYALFNAPHNADINIVGLNKVLDDLVSAEREACKECHLKDTVYDLLGDLKVANLKLSVRSQRTWVGLTDEERYELLSKADWVHDPESYAVLIETKLKEKNT